MHVRAQLSHGTVKCSHVEQPDWFVSTYGRTPFAAAKLAVTSSVVP
jgi:hypothetical protein